MDFDLIDDLVEGIKRVVMPDRMLFKKVILESGLPNSSQNFKYLRYNRQTIEEPNRTLSLSVVAIVNNWRAREYQLQGFRKALSRKVFAYSRNYMDVFLNNLRCDENLIDVMAETAHNYSLVGILQIEEVVGAGLFKRRYRSVLPVVVIPGIDPAGLETVVQFENRNAIRRVKRRFLPLYKKVNYAGEASLL